MNFKVGPAFGLWQDSDWLLLARFPVRIVNTSEGSFRSLHFEQNEVNVKLKIKETWL